MFNVFLNTKVNDLSEEIKTYVLNMFDDYQLLTEEQGINDKFNSNHTKDASLTKKYTVDISLSDYDIDADLINYNSLSELYSDFNKDYLYVQLNAMMYIFSPQEMDARNNETAGYIEKYIDLICADKEKYRLDYEMIFDSDENYHKILHKLVSDTNDSHWLAYMEEMKYFYNPYTHNLIQLNINVFQENEDFCETLFIKSMLVIAYVFKSINRYYTHDNLNAIYINKLLVTNELKEQDIKYFNNFIKYINKTTDEFKLKLLKTVHNRLNIAKKCLDKKHKPPFYIKHIHSNDLIEEYTI